MHEPTAPAVRRVWPRRLLIELIATVLLTVLIAWGCAWSYSSTNQAAMGMAGVPGFPSGWVGDVPDDWPDTPFGTARIGNPAVFSDLPYDGPWVRLRQGTFNGVSVSNAGVMFINDDPSRVIDEIRTGWPLNTMRTLGPDDARGLTGLWVEGIGVPAVQPLGLKPDRRLPAWPVWGAFLVTVLIWVGLLELAWQLFMLPKRLRRRSRRKQGRCLACGYDLAEMDRCPECDSPAE